MAANTVDEKLIDKIVKSLKTRPRKVGEIAKIAGCSERSVHRHLSRIETRGIRIAKELGKNGAYFLIA
tara:strand:+ start:126 stop:329 length:204 start_codon:yes stop_codon:yes gene_type:complete